ncbi:GGDEF domain-containing response regulator [Chitinivorax sp. B]|uniref:GGDEF domain-containing response regulator n=1 Tax=Chitinivorax sp. B TaxID=2502235 RepID=UPI001485052A|nr:GGDEF domain-containing response regulator [Chitinivorax sp. B]
MFISSHTAHLSVLILASQADAQPLVSLLTPHGHHVRHTDDSTHAITIAEELIPDLILVDGDLTGDDLASTIDAMRPTPSHLQPLVTGLANDEAGLSRLVAAGCDDVLVKPILNELLIAKAQWLYTARPRMGRSATLVADRAHGGLDPVTGLPNRFLFDDRLTHAIYRARRDLFKLALLLLDLDGFKHIHDRFGDEATELALREIGGRLLTALRKTDTVARIGHDKFAILLEQTDKQDDIAMLAKRLIDRVNLPVDFAGVPITLGASIGIALFPLDGSEVEPLHKAVDLAMYKAKQSGKNTYAFISERHEQDICMLNPS